VKDIMPGGESLNDHVTRNNTSSRGNTRKLSWNTEGRAAKSSQRSDLVSTMVDRRSSLMSVATTGTTQTQTKEEVGCFERIKQGLVGTVSLATLVAHAISILNNHIVLYVSAIFALIASCLALVNERRLAQQETFRNAMNDLRDECIFIEEENDKIKDTINRLEQSADEVREIEGGLNDMARSQGADVQQLLQLVSSNKKFQSQMKEIIRLKAGQDLITLVMECDHDENFKISGPEVDELILRVSTLDSARIDENRFREAIEEQDGNVNLIIDMVGKTVGNNEAEEDLDFVHMADSVVYLESMRSQLFSEVAPRGQNW